MKEFVFQTCCMEDTFFSFSFFTPTIEIKSFSYWLATFIFFNEILNGHINGNIKLCSTFIILFTIRILLFAVFRKSFMVCQFKSLDYNFLLDYIETSV